MRRNRRKNLISEGEAIFLLVAGLLFGTLFVVGMSHWEKDVSRGEAIHTEATFQCYEEEYRRGHLKEIIIRFSDLKQQSIDGTCANSGIISQLKTIAPGTVVSLILHPNSNTILEMTADGKSILTFDQTRTALRKEVNGFRIFGFACYGIAALAGVQLLRKKCV